MTKEEWTGLLEAHEHWRAHNKHGDVVVIENTLNGRWYAIDPLSNVSPKEAEATLEGSREPQELHTISRIVGYYSRTDNWNKSKAGELESRRRGDYSLPEKGA